MLLTSHDVDPALALWSELPGGSAQLINHSENHTFLIDTPHGERFTLRVHRQNYQSRPMVESELAWLEALKRDTDLPIATPVAGRDGSLIQTIATGQGERLAVLFRFLPGDEPSFEQDLRGVFRKLGAYAATMHAQVRAWPRPQGFVRQVWSAGNILDPDGLWGDWRVAPGVDHATRPVLDRLDAELRRRLADYGTGADRYGLIHADMRLGNLLVHGDEVNLIDFDDSGFCWFTYDFAAAISFHETHDAIPALKSAWLDGYGTVGSLSAEDMAAMDSMVMLRRMALLAWIGSHNETGLAQEHMPGFAQGTVQLAERYLRGPLWN